MNQAIIVVATITMAVALAAQGHAAEPAEKASGQGQGQGEDQGRSERPASSGETSRDVYPITAALEIGGNFSQLMSRLGSSLTVNLEGAYLLPAFGHRLAVFGSIGYVTPRHISTSSDARVPGGAYRFNIREHEVILAVGPMMRLFKPRTQLNFYGQTGLQVRLQRADVRGRADTGFGENKETATEVGALLAGGVEFLWGPGAIAAELNITFADLHHSVTGDSTAGGVALHAGYMLMF